MAACAPSLSQPFSSFKDSPVIVHRLQNYEPPQAAPPGGLALPPQIQQWLSAGAQWLPPGLLPPNLIPGATPAAGSSASDASRFRSFRILGTSAVSDKALHDEVLALFGRESNFTQPRASCMYAEFGFQIGYAPAFGAPSAPPGASSSMPPADILVSLSCGQVQMIGYAWPYGAKTGLTEEASKKVAAIARKAFGT